MAIRDRDTLKKWFQTGLYPIQEQFADWIDSFIHKNEGVKVSDVQGLAEYLNERNTELLTSISEQNQVLIDEVNRLINEVAKNLQLQRRFTASLETQTFRFYVGREVTTVYRVECDNIKSISVNGTDIPLTVYDDNESESYGVAEIDGVGWITISIENKLTDAESGIYIYGKAKE
ncbi:MAG: hypothetical protein E6767_20365 [Dysgonomonas sp.]|nr:hypothetical protein [Dysgonomonas sp.]